LAEIISKVDQVVKSPKTWAIIAQISGMRPEEIQKTLQATLSSNQSETVTNLQKLYQALLLKVPQRKYEKVT